MTDSTLTDSTLTDSTLTDRTSTDSATPIGDGRWAVPGNRWDLLTGQPSRAERGAPETSIVVPYFENQHDLDLLLTALRAQTHPMSRLQVVIADDGSAQPPDVDAADGAYEVLVVRQANLGFRAGAARNLGFAQAQGSVMLFLDGDTVPEPHYVERLSHLPDLLPDAVVSGRRRYCDFTGVTPGEVTEWFAGRAPGPSALTEPAWLTDEYRRTGNLLEAHTRSYKYLIGAVLGCSREMFAELSGFDESITGYGGEDYDFTYRAYNAGGVLAHVPDAVAWHDGHDWAGRTAPAMQTAQKNREILTLATRIPEPSMRGRGQLYATPDVVVSVRNRGWSLGAGVRCVRSLLATLDCRVSITDSGTGAAELLDAFREDPRVLGPSGADELGRSGRPRWYLEIATPVLVTDGFAEFLSGLLEADVGTLAVLDGADAVLTAESARRRRRADRHPEVPARARELWFARREAEPQECGLTVVETEPALAAIFGGYGE